MSTTRDPFRQPSSDVRVPSGPRYTHAAPERRLALSGLIRRTLNSVAEREQARSQLLNVLILAQALLTVAVTIGYVGTASEAPVIGAGAAAVLVYLAALVTNRAFRRVSLAAYILVAGGGLAVAAQAIVLAAGGNSLHAAHATLLFPAIILEAGLLFAPEVTLIIAAAAATLSAFAILLALSLAPNVDRHEAYLLIVYTLGLQAIAGLIAWLLSQFILESAVEAQRSEEMQFAQARLDALAGQVNEQHSILNENIVAIQSAIARAISGEFSVRVEMPEGDLSPLADSLNLLLQRVESVSHAEQMRSRVEAAALPLIDSIARMADAGTPTPASLPIMTGTSLDSLSVVLGQMQQAVAQRLARVQRQATAMVGALAHSQDGLTGTSDAVHEAQRIAGALISTAEVMLVSSRRQVALLSQMQRRLGTMLPPGVAQVPQHEETHHDAAGLGPQEAAALLGLGPDLGIATPGYTQEFLALSASDQEDDDTRGIAPLTRPLPIVDLAAQVAGPATADVAPTLKVETSDDAEMEMAAPATDGEDAPAALTDIWNLLMHLDGEISQVSRSISQLTRDLGLQSRHMRQADTNIAWFQQALDSMRSSAEQLQQVAGAALPPPSPDFPPSPPSRPLEQPVPRGPQKTRPLADKLEDGTLAELAPYANEAAQVEATVPAPGSLRAADLILLTGEGHSVQPVPPDGPQSWQGQEQAGQ